MWTSQRDSFGSWRLDDSLLNDASTWHQLDPRTQWVNLRINNLHSTNSTTHLYLTCCRDTSVNCVTWLVCHTVSDVATHAHTDTHTWTNTQKNTHTRTHTNTQKHTRIHTNTHAHKHTRTHTRTHTYTPAAKAIRGRGGSLRWCRRSAQIHKYTHTHKHTHTLTNTSTNTLTHTHIHRYILA